MPRNYTRAQQRKYREKRRKQASLVADRLLGKKNLEDKLIDPDVSDWLTSTISYSHFYKNSLTGYMGIPRQFIINSIEGV